MAFAPDGKQLLLGSQSGIEQRAWPDLKPVAKLPCELSHVHDLAFSLDGKTLLAAGGTPARGGAVDVLQWPGGARAKRLNGFKDVVYRVAWSSDGKRWAAASGDGTCRVYAADSSKELIRYEGHSRPVLAIAFFPEGKSIVSAGVDQSIQLWEAQTGKLIRTLDNHTAMVNDLGLRPNRPNDKLPVLASASEDRTVRLWQPTIGRMLRFIRLESAPRVIAWSPEGDRLIAACNDGKVRVLDPDTLAILQEQPVANGRIHAIALARQGKVGVGAGVFGPAKFEWK